MTTQHQVHTFSLTTQRSQVHTVTMTTQRSQAQADYNTGGGNVLGHGDTFYWGTFSGDTVYWGTFSGDTFYWGTFSGTVTIVTGGIFSGPMEYSGL